MKATTALHDVIADAKTKTPQEGEQLLVNWLKDPEHTVETDNLPDILSLVRKEFQLPILIKWSGQPDNAVELATLQKMLPLADNDGQKLIIQEWFKYPEHLLDIDFVQGIIPLVSDKNKLEGLQQWCEDPDNSLDLDKARYLLDLSGFETSNSAYYGMLQRAIIKRLAERDSSPLAHIPLENRLLAGTLMLEGKIPTYALTNPNALVMAIFNSYDALLLLDSDEVPFERLTKLSANEIDGFSRKTLSESVGEEVYDAAKALDFNTTYGVEIECCAKEFQHYHPFSWNRTVDQSVTASNSGEETAEYVSPILSKTNVQGIGVMGKQLAESGAYANLSCGLHIHAGMLPSPGAEMGNETLNLIKQVLVNYIVLEKEGLGFPKRTWKVDDYKDVLGEKYTLQDIIEAPTVKELMQITQPRGYAGAKVNLEALFKHGTIEFREASGTVNPNDILSWMKCVDTLVGQSIAMTKDANIPHIPSETELAVLQSAMVELQAHNSCINGSTLGGGSASRVEKMGLYLMSAELPPMQSMVLMRAMGSVFENQLDIIFNALSSSQFVLTQAVEKYFSKAPDPFSAFLDAFEKQSFVELKTQTDAFVEQGAAPEMAVMFIGSPEQLNTLFSGLRAEMEKYAPKTAEGQKGKKDFIQDIIKKGSKQPLEEKTDESKGSTHKGRFV